MSTHRPKSSELRDNRRFFQEEEEGEEGEEEEQAGYVVEEREPTRDAVVTQATLRQAVAHGAEPVRRTSRRVPKPIDMYEPG